MAVFCLFSGFLFLVFFKKTKKARVKPLSELAGMTGQDAKGPLQSPSPWLEFVLLPPGVSFASFPLHSLCFNDGHGSAFFFSSVRGVDRKKKGGGNYYCYASIRQLLGNKTGKQRNDERTTERQNSIPEKMYDSDDRKQ